MSVMWDELTAAALNAQAAAGAIVLLPVASTEQHGPHLATGVDVILCREVCRRTAERLVAKKTPAIVAPTLWPGLAEHHMPLGGSFTLSLATWHRVVEELCRSIIRAGFGKILIVNGHGGNMSALNALTVDLTLALNTPIATTTYFASAETAYSEILEDQRSVLHACEAETSMMLAVRPDLVDTTKLRKAIGPVPSGAGSVLAPSLFRWKSFKEITKTGVVGDARRATAAKGERLLDAAAEALADRLAKGEPWA